MRESFLRGEHFGCRNSGLSRKYRSGTLEGSFCTIHGTRTTRNKSLTGVGNAETSSSACDRKKSHYTKADRAAYFSAIERCNKRNRRAVRDRTDRLNESRNHKPEGETFLIRLPDAPRLERVLLSRDAESRASSL